MFCIKKSEKLKGLNNFETEYVFKLLLEAFTHLIHWDIISLFEQLQLGCRNLQNKLENV